MTKSVKVEETEIVDIKEGSQNFQLLYAYILGNSK